MRLNLVIASHDIGVGRWHLAVRASCNSLLLSSVLTLGRAALRAVVDVALSLGLSLHDVVDVVMVLALAVLG